ncbi:MULTISPECIES: MlaD family protein [unclassified Gordonia (in: high G+C Gram-positive bacteria)]|uniref:MlaD family protein n=1 Tax=unclassified Gordonia (in: high G+C Gram-positive bacteria) TaxID=2657482 RepID=UPI001F1157E0|nr:MlaD family protein [Gordonia sp. ABSL49_1]MCH5644964.1 MlaD family protein [Gordonia sp. ABSL49_1]
MRSARSALMRLLLVASVVILAVYAIVTAINRPVGGDTETYRAEFSDVFGLHKNADVRIRGVAVGKVLDIDLQPSGVAQVELSVRTDNRLTDKDQLAIRFQNLVGQRYIAITRPDAASGEGQAIDPDHTIPVSRTIGSFDITKLFNGLRPILTGADPAVFNTFATNLLHLIQGEDGVGIGTVLGDIDRLAQFATNKRAMITVILANLATVSAQLQGKSSMINALMTNMGMLFDTLENRLDLLKAAFGTGSQVFPPIVDLMKSSFDVGLGGHDQISRRILELVPDTTKLTEVLGLVPTMLSTVNATMGQYGFDANCSHGEVALPAMGTILLGGGKVTLCRK